MLGPGFRQPSLVADAGFTQAFAYDASGNVEYVGKAVAGAAKSASAWQISKLTYGSNGVTDIQYASGSEQFKFIWNNRASYSYS